MKLYLKTKALLVSLAFCGAVQLMATAEAHEASTRKGGELTTNTILLAQTRLNRLSESETKDLLKDVDKNTRDFQKSVDLAVDDSRLNDSKREDNLNNSIKEFKDSVKQMRDRYSREKTFSSSEVQDVLNRAAKMDTFISRGRLKNDAIKQDWEDVRADLDIFARSSYGRGTSYNRR
ncbi:hypothetical protein [Chlorogloea sp. CCALA 695]|uniref:hypothetical protein n=1 Tax=Chlorogloea sp. CCALA 695 TaxID=2107693 RepID=UPI000D07A6D4|nr:hypothetical protein [Chlorogloea sp. CCALA 695]PSB34004.1 hypothetical protein C7B70_05050 [Chlorogloea sp. CCALA 695]